MSPSKTSVGLTDPDADSPPGTVTVEFVDTVAVVHMRCGENRLGPAFFDKMNAALDAVERNPAVLAMVTIGDGKFYSNGLDLQAVLREYAVDPQRAVEVGLVGAVKLYARLLTFPMPTVAALNGHTYAGGAVLALAHDVSVMSRTRGWWSLNEVHIKVHFGDFVTALLKAKLPGGATFNEAAALGRRYTAAEAERSDIVRSTCELPALQESAIVMARRLVAKRPYDREHLAAMKRRLYANVLREMSSKSTDIGLSAKL